MDIQALRQRLQQASDEEHYGHALQHWLQQRSGELHRAIALGDNGDSNLLGFARAYIGQVPDLLEQAGEVARNHGLSEQVLPVLRVASTFFARPAELPAEHSGLLELLDEAYLAQRLIEEVNERYMAAGAGPLIPLNNTTANLIVHHLLGEPFSNQLDLAVQRAVERLLPARVFEQSAFADYRLASASQTARSAWASCSCLSSELGLSLRLPQCANHLPCPLDDQD